MARFNRVKTNRLDVFRNIDVRGSQMPASYGAGALGTVFGPKKWQWSENGNIITELHVDITGLACVGTAANDVIGLAAGGAAYLDRVVTATHGLIYRAEMLCLEVPGEGTATIMADIDLSYDTLATLIYDGATDGPAITSGGSWTVGKLVVVEDCGTVFAANNYLYLGEGDAAATTGVYNAGQFIIRLYGHAALAA